ncbi:winged helix-turn-helix transcriptional regulator [Patescibacteria group bacterium]|nr:winged helix-turn-helix transcriptional regulator [Patescibacteria group bacterium]
MSSTPIVSKQSLTLLGLTEKDLAIYVALLRLGSAPLRRIAEEVGYNRGTTYDALKRLLDSGVVSYVDAKSHRYFTAEDPQKLRTLAIRKEMALKEAQLAIDTAIPALRALSGSAMHRAAVRYYEGDAGIRDILNDVLSTAELLPERVYRVYSSAEVRELIAQAWPNYTALRVKRKVHVRAIAIGPGGAEHGLDERRWLSTSASSSAYILMYGKKTAYISAGSDGRLFGAVIDDEAISSTQEMIFDAMWEGLGNRV